MPQSSTWWDRCLNQLSLSDVIWVDLRIKFDMASLTTYTEQLRFKHWTFHVPNVMHKLLYNTLFDPITPFLSLKACSSKWEKMARWVKNTKSNMASKLKDCSVCFCDMKYVCIDYKIPICNRCSDLEFNEDIEGWIPGKQVGYCYGCMRKLKFKGKFEEGKHDYNRDNSSKLNTELDGTKNKSSSSHLTTLCNVHHVCLPWALNCWRTADYCKAHKLSRMRLISTSESTVKPYHLDQAK